MEQQLGGLIFGPDFATLPVEIGRYETAFAFPRLCCCLDGVRLW